MIRSACVPHHRLLLDPGHRRYHLSTVYDHALWAMGSYAGTSHPFIRRRKARPGWISYFPSACLSSCMLFLLLIGVRCCKDIYFHSFVGGSATAAVPQASSAAMCARRVNHKRQNDSLVFCRFPVCRSLTASSTDGVITPLTTRVSTTRYLFRLPLAYRPPDCEKTQHEGFYDVSQVQENGRRSTLLWAKI